MTLKELCEAILVAEDDIVINNNVRLLRKETLLEICGSLIRYDLVTTRVTLAHSSVFEFLTSQAIKASDMRTYYLDRLTAQSSVTRRCIGYMCLLSSGGCPTHDALVQRVQDWPLLTYIAKTLFAHLHYTDINDDVRSILLRFFATHHLPRGGNFGAWVQVSCLTSGTISECPLQCTMPLALVLSDAEKYCQGGKEQEFHLITELCSM